MKQSDKRMGDSTLAIHGGRRLDEAIRRPGNRLQPLADAVNRLVVMTIDPHVMFTGQLSQDRVGFDLDAVRGEEEFRAKRHLFSGHPLGLPTRLDNASPCL